MQVELVDRLNAEALILTVRWTESSTGNSETVTVCVPLNVDEIPAVAFESEEETVSIEVPERIRILAIAQAEHLAQRLSCLYRELPKT
jgi:hypothetical protein